MVCFVCGLTSHNITFSHIKTFLWSKNTSVFLSSCPAQGQINEKSHLLESNLKACFWPSAPPSLHRWIYWRTRRAEAINSSMLLQQTGASKHIELPHFQGNSVSVSFFYSSVQIIPVSSPPELDWGGRSRKSFICPTAATAWCKRKLRLGENT